MNADSVIEMRVRGAQEAASRARLAFLITIVACGTILVAIYNNYFAWNRIYLDQKRGLIQPVLRQPCLPSEFAAPTPPKGLTPTQTAEWTEAIQRQRDHVCETVGDLQRESNREDAKHLSDNNAISLPWLGISLGSADLDIFGSLGLYVACVYYLLCLRRLSRDIGSLLADSDRAEVIDRRYVYLGIRQALVLNIDADDAAPMSGNSGDVVRGLPSLLRILKFGPVMVIACMVVSDWWYLHTISYQGGWQSWWENLQPEFKVQFVLGSAIAIAVGLAILVLNQKAHTFERGIAEAMKGFAGDLQKSGEELVS
jgi:hypothetical protein